MRGVLVVVPCVDARKPIHITAVDSTLGGVSSVMRTWLVTLMTVSSEHVVCDVSSTTPTIGSAERSEPTFRRSGS